MAVRIPRPDRDHRKPGPQPEQQLRILVGGAVVRHFEDVDGGVFECRTQFLLRLRLHIAGEQHPDAPCFDEQHNAGVVGR
jgi:hypothetical protein